ncbi:MAG: tetratricopeptide repeat protein, partial [Thermodesulfobacteriota bacterium]
KAVAAGDDQIKPRLMLYNFYFSKGDFEQAEQELLRAIEKNPGNSDLHIILGLFYVSRKEMDKADKTFALAIEIDPRNIKPYLVSAEVLTASGQPDRALSLYREALRIQPENKRLNLILARFFLQQNKLIEAEKTIRKLLEEQPNDLPALILKGELLLIRQQYDEAITHFDRLIEQEPGSDRLHYLKAQAQNRKGDNTGAIASIQKALTIQPRNISAKLMLSDIYLQQGMIEQAQRENEQIFSMLHQSPAVRMILGNTAEIQQRGKETSVESFDTLFELASENPAGYLHVGQVEFFRKKYDQLMKNFESAFNANPKLLNVFTSIILLHAVKDEYDIAIRKCNEQIERMKNEPALQALVQNLLGGLYLAQNKTEPAESAFKKAIALNPNYLKPYYGLARVYLINKKVDKAVEQYQALASKDPTQTGPHMVLGTLFSMLQRYDLAEQHYRTALEINPDFIPAANNLSYLLAEQGSSLDEALRLSLTAKSKKPDDPFIKDTLGWVYYKMGLYPDAVRELAESAEKLPDNATVNYHLGMAYYKSGQHKAAKAQLQKALRLNEKFPNAEHAMEILSGL